jgi:hypothetical protein
MLADLPRYRAVGAKRDTKDHKTNWTDYKLHLDVADGGIPIGCLPASASPRDSQAAIPLANMAAAKARRLQAGRGRPLQRTEHRRAGRLPTIWQGPKWTAQG